MKEKEEWKSYLGTNPCPNDFDKFWQERVQEANETKLDYKITPAPYPEYKTCSFKELRFIGMSGDDIYAKYILPKREGKLPLVLLFHGYPGAGRSFLELASFAGMGCALLAMDCPGQAGGSIDNNSYKSTTMGGHIVAGLDGEPEKMYYVKLFQTIRILTRIVKELPEIDLERVYVYGGSQGGAQGIVCAALAPELIKKAATLYPFLSDYKKVYELGRDEIAYEGLRYYARWFDPDGAREDEIFEKLGYIDVKNFAKMVECEVLFATGGEDTIFIGIFASTDFSNLMLNINGAEIKYGSFITAIINFVIMAFIIFCLVKGLNKLAPVGKKEEPKEVTEKTCPFCRSKISIKATRCPHCTSVLDIDMEM